MGDPATKVDEGRRKENSQFLMEKFIKVMEQKEGTKINKTK